MHPCRLIQVYTNMKTKCILVQRGMVQFTTCTCYKWLSVICIVLTQYTGNDNLNRTLHDQFMSHFYSPIAKLIWSYRSPYVLVCPLFRLSIFLSTFCFALFILIPRHPIKVTVLPPPPPPGHFFMGANGYEFEGLPPFSKTI